MVESSSARPELGLESLNPDALQSTEHNSSSYLRLETGFLCGKRERQSEGGGSGGEAKKTAVE